MQSANHVHQGTRTGDDALVNFQNNLAFISLLLKGDHEAAAERLRDGFVEPGEFAQFLQRHRLQLFVCSLLGGSPVQKWLPREWVDELKMFSLRQWATQERLVRELDPISTLLGAGGHEFILLKGPYLATRFSGGMNRREFFDLDILIRREELPAVERLLVRSGYVQKSSTLLNRSLTTYFTHAFDFVKPNVAVDLHWQFSAQLTHRLDYEAIWRQKRPFNLRGRDFLVLSDEYEVVFHIVSIFKELEMGMARLKAFIDLYLILSKVSPQIDWEAFLEFRKRERIRKVSLTVLALFLGFFDCRDNFRELAAVVAREEKLLKLLPARHHQALIETSPGATWNKLWASNVYECPRFAVFLWWVVSFPFRLAVYQPNGGIQRGVHYLKKRVWFKSSAAV
jgi:Uncharacterised nucleotidyltransferase